MDEIIGMYRMALATYVWDSWQEEVKTPITESSDHIEISSSLGTQV